MATSLAGAAPNSTVRYDLKRIVKPKKGKSSCGTYKSTDTDAVLKDLPPIVVDGVNVVTSTTLEKEYDNRRLQYSHQIDMYTGVYDQVMAEHNAANQNNGADADISKERFSRINRRQVHLSSAIDEFMHFLSAFFNNDDIEDMANEHGVNGISIWIAATGSGQDRSTWQCLPDMMQHYEVIYAAVKRVSMDLDKEFHKWQNQAVFTTPGAAALPSSSNIGQQKSYVQKIDSTLKPDPVLSMMDADMMALKEWNRAWKSWYTSQQFGNKPADEVRQYFLSCIDTDFKRYIENLDSNCKLSVNDLVRHVSNHVEQKYPVENRRAALLSHEMNMSMTAVNFLNQLYTEAMSCQMEAMNNEDIACMLWFQKHHDKELIKRLHSEFKSVRKLNVQQLSDAIRTVEAQDTLMNQRSVIQTICTLSQDLRETYQNLSPEEKDYANYTHDKRGRDDFLNIISSYKRKQRDSQFRTASNAYQVQKYGRQNYQGQFQSQGQGLYDQRPNVTYEKPRNSTWPRDISCKAPWHDTRTGRSHLCGYPNYWICPQHSRKIRPEQIEKAKREFKDSWEWADQMIKKRNSQRNNRAAVNMMDSVKYGPGEHEVVGYDYVPDMRDLSLNALENSDIDACEKTAEAYSNMENGLDSYFNMMTAYVAVPKEKVKAWNMQKRRMDDLLDFHCRQEMASEHERICRLGESYDLNLKSASLKGYAMGTLPIARVNIADTKRQRMAIIAMADSGSSASMISRKTVVRVGLHVDRQVDTKVFTANGELKTFGLITLEVEWFEVRAKISAIVVEGLPHEMLVVGFRDMISLRLITDKFPIPENSPEFPGARKCRMIREPDVFTEIIKPSDHDDHTVIDIQDSDDDMSTKADVREISAEQAETAAPTELELSDTTLNIMAEESDMTFRTPESMLRKVVSDARMERGEAHADAPITWTNRVEVGSKRKQTKASDDEPLHVRLLRMSNTVPRHVEKNRNMNVSITSSSEADSGTWSLPRREFDEDFKWPEQCEEYDPVAESNRVNQQKLSVRKRKRERDSSQICPDCADTKDCAEFKAKLRKIVNQVVNVEEVKRFYDDNDMCYNEFHGKE